MSATWHSLTPIAARLRGHQMPSEQRRTENPRNSVNRISQIRRSRRCETRLRIEPARRHQVINLPRCVTKIRTPRDRRGFRRTRLRRSDDNGRAKDQECPRRLVGPAGRSSHVRNAPVGLPSSAGSVDTRRAHEQNPLTFADRRLAISRQTSGLMLAREHLVVDHVAGHRRAR